MPDGLISMSDQFQGLPMRDLIGGPLSAACQSQVMLAKATSDYITTVGMEPPAESDAGPSKIRMVDFQYQRPEEITQQDGTVRVEAVNYNLKVPLLSIVSVPSLQIKKVDITFDMEVKSSTSDKSSSEQSASVEATGSVNFGIWSASVTVKGSVSARQENTRTSDNSAKYHVQVLAEQIPPPEGLSRMLDMLDKVIAPTPLPQASGGASTARGAASGGASTARGA